MFVTSILFAAAVSSSPLVAGGGNPSVISQNGTIIGVGFDATGGQRRLRVDGGASPHVRVRANFTPMNNLVIFNQAMKALGGVWESTNYVWDSRSQVWNAFRVGITNPRVAEIGCPALDGAAKDAAFFSIGYDCDDIRAGGIVDISPDAKAKVKGQKMWLPSNFRVSIGGLPASRVSKVDSFTLKQGVADLDGDGQMDFATTEPICFTIPVEDVAPYQEWFNKVSGGVADSREIVIEYQDPDGETLITISMLVEIESLGFESVFTTDPTLKAGQPVKVGVKQTGVAKGINSPNLLLNP